jgi:hypothetical protein
MQEERMKKVLKHFSYLAYPLVFTLVILSIPLPSFAEDLTITTYYPSPYGNYSELTVEQNLNISQNANIRSGTSVPASWTNVMKVTPTVITFSVPVVFSKVTTFNDTATFNKIAPQKAIITNGNLQINGYTDTTQDIRTNGKLIAQDNVVSANGEVYGQAINDMGNGWDLGDSLRQRYLYDLDVKGGITLTNTDLAAGAAIGFATAVDPGAKTAFGLVAGTAGLISLIWAAYTVPTNVPY